MKKRYYFLDWLEKEKLGVAYAEEGYEFDLLLENRYYSVWTPVTFLLKDGGYADYQANDLGWPLCSDKLKSIIDLYISVNDIIQWLDVQIIASSRESRVYHILHLPQRPDVLDKKRTLFAGQDVIVKPYFRRNVITKYNVVSFYGGGFRVIVSSELRKAISSSNCTGVDFYEARVV